MKGRLLRFRADVSGELLLVAPETISLVKPRVTSSGTDPASRAATLWLTNGDVWEVRDAFGDVVKAIEEAREAMMRVDSQA